MADVLDLEKIAEFSRCAIFGQVYQLRAIKGGL